MKSQQKTTTTITDHSTVLEPSIVLPKLSMWIGRAVRAHAKSKNTALPLEQRHFHDGRVEAYLQMVADICNVEVRQIRFEVLGSEYRGKHR